MDAIKSFLSDPSNLFELTGGLIALTAAIFGIFYKDTVKKDTYKLTGWGWAALLFLLLGAGINSSSKFYDFKKEQKQIALRDSVQHVQDSIRDLQVTKLVALTDSLNILKDTSFTNYTKTSNSFKSNLEKLKEINKGVDESYNSINPLFPLTLKYSLAIDLSNPILNGLLSLFQSKNANIEMLTDNEIRNSLSEFNNKSLNTVFNSTKNSSIAEYKVSFYKKEEDSILYFCRKTQTKLSIQKSKSNDKFYLVDESEYYTSSKPLGKTKIQNSNQLRDRKMSLIFYRYYVPEIPESLFPTIWSDMEIQFAKQPSFIIKKSRQDSWRQLDFKMTPYYLVKGQTTLKYTIENWDKLEDDY